MALAALKRRVDRLLDDPANEAARHDAIAAVTALSCAALEALEIGTPGNRFRSLDELLATLRATAVDADDCRAMTADEAFQHLTGLCVRTARPVAGRNRPPSGINTVGSWQARPSDEAAAGGAHRRARRRAPPTPISFRWPAFSAARRWLTELQARATESIAPADAAEPQPDVGSIGAGRSA